MPKGGDRPLLPGHVASQFQRRHSGRGKPPGSDDKKGGGRSYGASRDDDGDDFDSDDDMSDEEFKAWAEEETRALAHAIPVFYPRLPIIATAYPVFPRFMKVFEVTDPRLITMLENNFEGPFKSFAGVFTRKTGDGTDHTAEVKSLDEVHSVGTFVQITELAREGDKLRFVATAHRRIFITRELFVNPKEFDEHKVVKLEDKRSERGIDWNVMMVETTNVIEQAANCNTDRAKAVQMELVKTIRDIIMANTLIRDNLYNLLGNNLRVSNDPSYLADLSASITASTPAQMQAILCERDVSRRMESALELLKQEKQVLDLQKKIGEDVEEKVKQTHREYMLREQLKAVKKELGLQKDDGVALNEKFRKALEGKVVPQAVLDIIDEELKKLAYLEPNSTEFS